MKQDGSTLRKLPVGAEVIGPDKVHFRVWAANCRRVDLVLETPTIVQSRGPIPMTAENGQGYFSAAVDGVGAGVLYRYQLDRSHDLLADPASRFQPQGPEGPSQVIDPSTFSWTDVDWPGVKLPGQIIYEMHVGTFTQEGTWRAAARELPELAAAGITLLEVMPVADWPGEFGWGYDGVNPFAPTRLYGTPDDFRSFVDRAHQEKIGVTLDVVYNHLGERGNHFKQFAKAYFTSRYSNEWGDAINFDGEGSAAVREFFLANAHYWIEEFHLDGYRIDATQAFFDTSPEHILTAITRRARAAAGNRSIILIAESEPQQVRMVRPIDQGGHGMDAAWNDDFHHSAMVRLTGRNEAYYTDYLGDPQEFVSAVKYGYLYQGQLYKWQRKPRGTPTFGLPAATFVNYLQNHDQLANSLFGRRMHELTSPGRYRAMTAVLLLGPGTPLLFQGQEFAASTPFRYFLGNPSDRAKKIAEGRAKFLSQFRSLALSEMQARLPDPADPANFRACKLNFADRQAHAEAYALHKDLLRLRRSDPAISAQRADRLDGAVLSADAFVVRFFAGGGEDRLLVVNFGRDLHFDPVPEPLLAPPEKCRWQVLWSSEDPTYGGTGTPPLETEEGWQIPGEAAVVLRSKRRNQEI